MLDLDYSRPDIEAEIRAVRTPDDLETVLEKTLRVTGEFRKPHVYGRKLFMRGLDALMPVLARSLGLADVAQPPKSNDRIVVITTIVRRTGGHSQVIKDIMRSRPGQVTGIFTDVYRELAEDLGGRTEQTEFLERAWLSPRRRRLADRAIEVYQMLKAIQPTRILLFGHPMDMVPILAAWPFRDIAEFVHHADHIPSLGATLPFSGHVDLTYRCHLTCREAGLDAVFAGMTAPARPPETAAPRDRDGLVIATCGSPNKFDRKGAFAWTDYVVAALGARPDSRFVHIGPVTDHLQAMISEALAKAGIDLSRYRVTGTVPSLHAELLASGADIYLSSYPETGGKANLEAMAANLPVILPLDDDAPPLIRFDHPLRRWIPVSEPAGIGEAIAAALAGRDALEQPDALAELDAELGRFGRFVSGELTGV